MLRRAPLPSRPPAQRRQTRCREALAPAAAPCAEPAPDQRRARRTAAEAGCRGAGGAEALPSHRKREAQGSGALQSSAKPTRPKRGHRGGDKGAGGGGGLRGASEARRSEPHQAPEQRRGTLQGEGLWPARARRGVDWLRVKLLTWPDLLMGLYLSETNTGHVLRREERPPGSGVRPRRALRRRLLLPRPRRGGGRCGAPPGPAPQASPLLQGTPAPTNQPATGAPGDPQERRPPRRRQREPAPPPPQSQR